MKKTLNSKSGKVSLASPNSIKRASQQQLQRTIVRLYQQKVRYDQRKKQRHQKIQEMVNQQQLKQCTFKPKINQQNEYPVQKLQFLQRVINWNNDKIRKLEQRKIQKQQKSLKQFTFIPQITKSTIKIAQSIIQNINDEKETQSLVKQNKKGYKEIQANISKFRNITDKKTKPFQLLTSVIKNHHNLSDENKVNQINQQIKTKEYYFGKVGNNQNIDQNNYQNKTKNKDQLIVQNQPIQTIEKTNSVLIFKEQNNPETSQDKMQEIVYSEEDEKEKVHQKDLNTQPHNFNLVDSD